MLSSQYFLLGAIAPSGSTLLACMLYV